MYKPQFHFTPEKNWMNDPNGTVLIDGVYHLCYQYNPNDINWGDIHWAYATSDNLIDWKRRGIKLSPEKYKNERHCFSGCYFNFEDRYFLIYTSIGFEPDAVKNHSIQKFVEIDTQYNIINRDIPETLGPEIHPFVVTDWRDPFIFTYKNCTYMLIGGVIEKNGCILLYQSRNNVFNDWVFLKIIYSEKDHTLECPNLWIFGGTVVLIYCSIEDRPVKYLVGEFTASMDFLILNRGFVDYSSDVYYATNMSEGKNGLPILYAWLWDSLTKGTSIDGKNSGVLAFPREFWIGENSTLCMKPVDTRCLVDKCLFDAAEVSDTTIYSSTALLKYQMKIDLALLHEFEILANSTENILFSFNVKNLCIIKKSLHELSLNTNSSCDLSSLQGIVDIEILVDNSIIEIYIANRVCLSVRFYLLKKSEICFRQHAGYLESLTIMALHPATVATSTE